MFLTSNYGPTYQEGNIRDGGPSNGDIPAALTPAPSSVVLVSMGLIVAGGVYVLRRRKAVLALGLAS